MELKKKLAEKPGRTAKEAKLQEEGASELRRLKTCLTEVRCPAAAGVQLLGLPIGLLPGDRAGVRFLGCH